MTLALAALAAGGCSSEDPPQAFVGRRLATTTSTAAVGTDVYPLTGLPVDDPARAARPALTVKIENEPLARPQSGLDAADVVYEERIEGGDTRFVAIFHSSDADPVGSIRSVRPNDAEMVAPVGGLFAYSGGTAKFVALLTDPIVDVGEPSRPAAYFTRREKASDHRLFSSTTRLYAAAGSAVTGPPRPLFTFVRPGEVFESPGAVPASHVDTRVGNQRITYDWDAAKGWLRSINGRPHLVEGGEQHAPPHVIVQAVAWGNSPGDSDTLGAPVPLAELIGTGDALILSGGKALAATWSKSGRDAATAYTALDGTPVRLAPGRTWVELSQQGSPPTFG